MKHITFAFAALATLTVIPATAQSHRPMPAGLVVTCVDDSHPRSRMTFVFTRDSVTINGSRKPAVNQFNGLQVTGTGDFFTATPNYRNWTVMGANISRTEWFKCRTR